jgi:hypothetical protein
VLHDGGAGAGGRVGQKRRRASEIEIDSAAFSHRSRVSLSCVSWGGQGKMLSRCIDSFARIDAGFAADRAASI